MRQRLPDLMAPMRLKLPSPRLRLRTLVILIAALAVALWGGLSIWSPTRRLGRLLQSDQPVYVRREAASSLGRDIPPWETDQAVSLLLAALNDPSPRVREYAGVGLAELGPRAERAIPKLISVLNDEDRFVRFSAARTIGFILETGSASRAEAVAALTRTLDDKDPEVRLAAAETLVQIGEAGKAAGLLVAVFSGSNAYLSDRARLIMRRAKDPHPFVALLVKELRDKHGRRRNDTLQTLLAIASPEAVRAALASLLSHEDPEIRQWAAERLERITPNP
jgi:HEAT repeat protein